MRRIVEYPGASLSYLTAFPPAYDAAQTYPLIIALHGFGADKSDLTGLAKVLAPLSALFIFPDAPRQAFDGADVTARAWYERGGNESPAAVEDALQALDGFVTEVHTLYKPSRTVLLGFSQGGAMALRYGIPRPDVFAGLAVLSGSLRRVSDLLPTLPERRTQPIFVAHGTQDAVVPLADSQRLVEFLKAERYRPVYHSYRCGHCLDRQELLDLQAWLQQILGDR